MAKNPRFIQEEAEEEKDSDHSNRGDSSEEEDEDVPDEFEQDDFITYDEEDEAEESRDEEADHDEESRGKRKRQGPPGLMWMPDVEEPELKRRKVGNFKRLKKKKSMIEEEEEIIHDTLQEKDDDGDDISNFIVGSTHDDYMEPGSSSMTTTIFGEEYNMEEMEAEEEEDEDEYEENKYKRLSKHFSTDELKSRYMTEEDDRIREVDIAERVFSKHGDRTLTQDEFARESAWIVKNIFSRNTDADKIPKYQAVVGFVLKQIYVEKFDIPYIATYLKEYWTDIISVDDLWTIWEWDELWVNLQGRKQVVKGLYDFPEISVPDLYKDILREASSGEVIKDLSQHFYLHYANDAMDKRPAKRNLYNIAKRIPSFTDLAKEVAISSFQYVHNLRSGMALHMVSDPELDPEEFATHNTSQQFPTPASLLKVLRHFHAYEISKEPHVRSILREAYERFATISTSLTEKGRTAGIFRGSISRNLKNVALQAFTETDEKYIELMKILRAKRDGLLDVEVNISSDDLDYVLDPVACYHSDKSNEIAASWNKFRSQIIDEVKSLLKQELSEYVLDFHQKAGCRVIGRYCSKYIYSLLMTGPYITQFEGSEKQFEKNQGKVDTNFQYFPPKGSFQYKDPPGITKNAVLACVPGKTKDEPIVFVFLDPNGNVQETLMWRFPPYISKRVKLPVGTADLSPIPDKEKNDQQLKQEKMLQLNIRKFRPDVIAIAASGLDCRVLFRIVDDAQEKLPQEHRVRMQFVSDDIACLYENSDLANTELKEIAPVVRRAISLGRYLNDPITEVSRLMNHKGDLLYLKMHPLQDMLRTSQLQEYVEQAFTRAVNEIGVDLNRIIPYKHLQSTLQFVSGLGPRKADYLLRYLNSRGELHSREELKDIFETNVFNNCAGFLRINSTKSIEDEAVLFRPLDNTRIHPSDYPLAHKICFDALEVEIEDDDEVDEQIWNLMDLYDENGKWIGEDQDKLEELDLELYAQNLEELGYGKKFITLKDIKEELKTPFKNPRRKYTPMNERDVFYSALHETPSNFSNGSLVYLNITDVTSSRIFGHLDNGVKGYIVAAKLPRSNIPLNQRYSVDQSLEAVVLKIEYSNFMVELSATEHDLKEYRQSEQEDYKKTTEKKQRKFLTRSIDHPYFKNFTNEETLNYLKDKPPGECVIRPSSRGLSTLTLAYKWFGGSIINVEIREKNKKSPLSLGDELWVKNQKYGDLDELHYNIVELVMEKAEQVVTHPKYSEMPREDIIEKLRQEKRKNAAIIPYCIGTYQKYPGKFFVFYLPGTNTILYEPFTISANGFHFVNRTFKSPTQLINHFKQHLKELPSYKRRLQENSY